MTPTPVKIQLTPALMQKIKAQKVRVITVTTPLSGGVVMSNDYVSYEDAVKLGIVEAN